MYAIASGLQLLVAYGWPAYAKQDKESCTLAQDRPIVITGREIPTTDADTGDEAFYELGYERPLLFNSITAAQYTIDRFQIAGAYPVAWRGR